MALPLVDLGLAVIRRTRAGRNPFAPDKQHLHHRLLEMGHSQRRAVFLMYAWTALIAGAALAIAFFPLIYAGVGTAIGVVIMVFLVRRTPTKFTVDQVEPHTGRIGRIS
jgi:UDP-GlcNAc:undecaprenyl-phosphate GlcNAc-1-phosphate transferase